MTDENMERYFMGLEEAAEFIVEATEIMESGQILVPANAKCSKIIDLARQLSDNIKIVGIRSGEKIKERLLTDEEMERANQMGDMWVIR